MIQKAENINPNSAKVDVMYAMLAEAEKNYEQVIKLCQKAISKKPDKKTLLDAHESMSSAYRRLGKYNLAEKSYLEIISLDGESPWVRINYSNFLSKYKKEHDKAIVQGEKALKLMDFGMGHKILSEVFYRKAFQLLQNKQYDDSIEYFEKSIKHNKNNANAYYGLGMAYYYIGYYHRDKSKILLAEKSLSRAVEIKPDHKQAIEQLSNVRKLIKAID